jgi:hypothetical protein
MCARSCRHWQQCRTWTCWTKAMSCYTTGSLLAWHCCVSSVSRDEYWQPRLAAALPVVACQGSARRVWVTCWCLLNSMVPGVFALHQAAASPASFCNTIWHKDMLIVCADSSLCMPAAAGSRCLHGLSACAPSRRCCGPSLSWLTRLRQAAPSYMATVWQCGHPQLKGAAW